MADPVAPVVPAAPAPAPAPAAASPPPSTPASAEPVAAIAVGSPGSGPESISGAAQGETPPSAPADVAVSSPPEATSILSEATSGEGAPAEAPVADAKPEEGAEKPAAEAAPVEPPKEPLPKPVYDALTLPEGVTADDTQVAAFSDLIGDFETRVATDPTTAHVAFSELRQKLADMHVAALQEAVSRHDQARTESWNRLQEEWASAFRADPQIGKAREKTSLQTMGRLLEQYGVERGKQRETSLRAKFGVTGMGNTLEMLDFAVWAAGKRVETARIVTPTMPKGQVNGGSRAERLYSKSLPQQGAA